MQFYVLCHLDELHAEDVASLSAGLRSAPESERREGWRVPSIQVACCVPRRRRASPMHGVKPVRSRVYMLETIPKTITSQSGCKEDDSPCSVGCLASECTLQLGCFRLTKDRLPFMDEVTGEVVTATHVKLSRQKPRLCGDRERRWGLNINEAQKDSSVLFCCCQLWEDGQVS